MKISLATLAMLCLIMISQSCQDVSEPIQPKLAIGFTALSSNHETITNLPSGSKLVLNVQSQYGEPVMEYQEVQFQFLNNHFLINPIDLAFGKYTVTDFILVDENDYIIYAAPKDSGALGNTVDNPLQFSFTFAPAIMHNIHFQLLEVRGHKPADFGYASFKKPVKGNRKLSVIVSLEGSGKATAAKASIILGGDTLKQYNLAAKMNQITLPPGLNTNHQLVITKSGYAPVRLILEDLSRSYRNKPLKVVLARAFTLVAYLEDLYFNPFEFYIEGPDGAAVTVDWGDGETQDYNLSSTESSFSHHYSESGNHPISITGDIEKITYFKCFYDQRIRDINFQHLTDLVEIRFGLTSSPRVVDLRDNTKLQFVMLPALNNMEALYLPKEHRIEYLSLDGDALSTEAVDAVINNVYENTISQNVVNGWIGLPATLYQPEEDETLLGPPSAEAMAKLRVLKEDYGWAIYPDPF
ncbi:MAG: hypothetical protein ABIR06_02445 [Cyclobacteriaceae bacterium]